MNKDPFKEYIKNQSLKREIKDMHGILQLVCRLWMD